MASERIDYEPVFELLKKGDLEGARRHLLGLLETWPQDSGLRARLQQVESALHQAHLRQWAADQQTQLEIQRQAVFQDPLRYANAYLAAGRLPEGLQLLQIALARDPGNQQLYDLAQNVARTIQERPSEVSFAPPNQPPASDWNAAAPTGSAWEAQPAPPAAVPSGTYPAYHSGYYSPPGPVAVPHGSVPPPPPPPPNWEPGLPNSAAWPGPRISAPGEDVPTPVSNVVVAPPTPPPSEPIIEPRTNEAQSEIGLALADAKQAERAALRRHSEPPEDVRHHWSRASAAEIERRESGPKAPEPRPLSVPTPAEDVDLLSSEQQTDWGRRSLGPQEARTEIAPKTSAPPVEQEEALPVPEPVQDDDLQFTLAKPRPRQVSTGLSGERAQKAELLEELLDRIARHRRHPEERGL